MGHNLLMPDPGRKQRFLEELRGRAKGSMRLAALLASLSFISFALVDPLLIDGSVRTAYIVRAVSVLLFAGLAATTLAERFFLRFATPLTLLACLAIGMGVNVLTLLTGGGTSEYHSALIICFFAFALLPLPWGRWTAMAVFVGLALGYDVLMIASGTTGPLGVWVTHNAVVWAGAIIAGALFHFAMTLRQDDFANREQLARANERLHALDKAKSRFFANVSHELRTPLTLALAPVQALLEEGSAPLDEMQRGQLQMVDRNALRLLRLVDDLLELSKAEAAAVRLYPTSLDLRAHVHDLVQQVIPLARRKQLTLTMEDGPAVKAVGADPDQMERVVLNILGNAIKFTPDGGTIVVRVFERDDRLYLEVEDDGPGIPEDERARIFDRFHQVDGSSTRSHGGTGIGLALARELVELHLGKVFARANGETGATVGFSLRAGGGIAVPRSQPAPVEPDGTEGLPEWHEALRRQDAYRLRQIQDATERRLAPRSPAGTRAHTVLVVEDNTDMIRFVSTLLSAEHHVLTSTDGAAGLRLAYERRPDLIVSDVMMPGLNGFELVDALRKDPATRPIPVILLTARGDAEDRLEGRTSGANAYLTKPFHANELMAAVRSLLSTRGALIEGAEARRSESVQFLAGGMAEEFSEPLDTIEEALDGAPDAVLARQALRELREAVGDVDRLERAGTAPRTRVSLDAVVTAALDDASVSTEKELRATRPVLANEEELGGVVRQLLANARRAGRAGGRIQVRTWDEAGGGVSLSVSDDGPGVAAEAAERIFQPFYSTEPGRRGMGLAVARRIADAYGGRLTLAPGGPGATFVLHLPGTPPGP